MLARITATTGHRFARITTTIGYLLGALSNLDPRVLLEGVGIFEEFKGALTEQYVLQEIVAAQNKVPLYWGRGAERGHAELDFAIEKPAGLVPIEVKAEENLRSKSLRAYVDRYHPHEALRFSLANYRAQADMTNVPLYAIRPWLTCSTRRCAAAAA